MSRFSRNGRVFFIEEPVIAEDSSYLDVSEIKDNVYVCVPHLSLDTDSDHVSAIVSDQIKALKRTRQMNECVCWFYTPMMLPWTNSLGSAAIVYDCMDELSGFKNAPFQDVLPEE